MSNNDTTRACPHLGLAEDASTRCLFANAAHRCFRWPPPTTVDEAHQSSFCLSDGYRNCPRLENPATVSPPQGTQSATASDRNRMLGAIALVSLALLGLSLVGRWPASGFALPSIEREEAPSQAVAPTRRPSSALSAPAPPAVTATPRVSPTVSVPGSVGIAASTLAAAKAAPTTALAGQAGTPSPAPSPTLGPLWTPTRGTASATSTRSAASAVLAATPPPPGASPGLRIYAVKSGDNLGKIADLFGVSVDDLLLANNLKREDLIRVDQRLLIPERGR